MASPDTRLVDRRSALQQRLPHQLIPTNLDGAFATPAYAKEFDPNTASASELMKHGIFLQRPSREDPPEVQAAWQKVFSKKWLPENRIVPRLETKRGVTHNRRKFIKTNAGFSSNNWGGGSISGSWVTAVGTWAVPTVSKPPEGQGKEGGWNSSSWVGIDGAYGSNDVLQAGVEQRVDGSGNASYVAWFEWFTNGQVGGTINDFSNRKVILGDTSPLSPSLASFNGNLYIAWKGDGNDNLNVMVSTDNGQSFGNKLISQETSSEAPGLAADSANLYITWKG